MSARVVSLWVVLVSIFSTVESQTLACTALGGVFRSGNTSTGSVSAPGLLANLSCTFVLGAPGWTTTLSNVTADGEPVGLSLSVYGAQKLKGVPAVGALSAFCASAPCIRYFTILAH